MENSHQQLVTSQWSLFFPWPKGRVLGTYFQATPLQHLLWKLNSRVLILPFELEFVPHEVSSPSPEKSQGTHLFFCCSSRIACLSQVTKVCSDSPVWCFAYPCLSQRTLTRVDEEFTASLSVLHSAVSWISWTFQVLLFVAFKDCRGLQYSKYTILSKMHHS